MIRLSMNWLLIVSTLCLSLFLYNHGVVAVHEHRMIRLHARQQAGVAAEAKPEPVSTRPKVDAQPVSFAPREDAQQVPVQPQANTQMVPTKPNARKHQVAKAGALVTKPQSSPSTPLGTTTTFDQAAADPGLKLTEDSDADETLHHEEAMRLFMRAKAESVIASNAGASFTSYELECILNGTFPSLHPGSLSNVSWTMDMFESGVTLPTTSSSADHPMMVSLMSTDSAVAAPPKNDLNVDHLLDSFFHADGVRTIFEKVQSETNQRLDKQTKKTIIKQTAPILHKTIERVAGHRGWGIQDARFAQIHLEEQGESEDDEAFKDYNTFVKTMRSALITPIDAAKDSAKEQQEAPRKNLADKA